MNDNYSTGGKPAEEHPHTFEVYPPDPGIYPGQITWPQYVAQWQLSNLTVQVQGIEEVPCWLHRHIQRCLLGIKWTIYGKNPWYDKPLAVYKRLAHKVWRAWHLHILRRLGDFIQLT